MTKKEDFIQLLEAGINRAEDPVLFEKMEKWLIHQLKKSFALKLRLVAEIKSNPKSSWKKDFIRNVDKVCIDIAIKELKRDLVTKKLQEMYCSYGEYGGLRHVGLPYYWANSMRRTVFVMEVER